MIGVRLLVAEQLLIPILYMPILLSEFREWYAVSYFTGKSIIIAQTGINHKAPYDRIDGKPVTIQDPELTVDLSKADFEVYLGDYNISIERNHTCGTFKIL